MLQAVSLIPFWSRCSQDSPMTRVFNFCGIFRGAYSCTFLPTSTTTVPRFATSKNLAACNLYSAFTSSVGELSLSKRNGTSRRADCVGCVCERHGYMIVLQKFISEHKSLMLLEAYSLHTSAFPQARFHLLQRLSIFGTANPVYGDESLHRIVKCRIEVWHLSRSSCVGHVFEQNDAPIKLLLYVKLTSLESA